MGGYASFLRVEENKNLVLIGTGDFGLALMKVLIQRGYQVTGACRNPDQYRERAKDVGGTVEDLNNPDIYEQANIVIVAVPPQGFASLPVNLLKDKIIIDVSNRSSEPTTSEPSHASQLQDALPNCKVVKAFNTLSAHVLRENAYQPCRQVPVCSDDAEARQTVIDLIKDLGFTPLDKGILSNATEIETIPHRFFPQWKLAICITIVVFLFAFFVMLMRNQICPNACITTISGTVCNNWNSRNWNLTLFNNIILDDTKTSFALTAVVLLAVCYLPGVLSQWCQRCRRRKCWVRKLECLFHGRKQIGLLALLCSWLHFMMVIFTVIEHGLYLNFFYLSQLAIGSIALTILTVVGTASIPCVGQSQSWREIDCILNCFGWGTLFLVVWHMIFSKLEHWILLEADLRCKYIPDEGMIFLVLPGFTVLVKIFLIVWDLVAGFFNCFKRKPEYRRIP